MRNLFLCLLLLVASTCYAQVPATEKLSGTVAIPNSASFNGEISLKLNSSNIKNICTTPAQYVPTMFATYLVVNGVPQGISSANFLSQDCMSPRIPYYVEIADTKGTLVGSDNWYIPRTVSGTADIGMMQEQHFGGGPITVAIPYGIISLPSVSQSITQPVGTSFDFYGTVNFHGQVNFLNPIDFSTVIANQVLVGGITSSTFALDVQGGINTSQGYYYGGSGGTAGQCIVSDGISGKWGACSAAFPTLYYQLFQSQSTSLPQTIALDTSARFALTHESATQTLLDLATVGTPGTYTNIQSATVDSYGRVTAITSGTVAPVVVPGTLTTPGRSFGVTYPNSYPSAIFISGYGITSGSSVGGINCYVNGVLVFSNTSAATVDNGQNGFACMVPAGSSYMVTATGATNRGVGSWVEIVL